MAAATLVAAICANSSLAASPARLQPGSNGSSVTVLQQDLHMNVHADYYGSAFDGAFGPLTMSGLQRWQKAEGYRPTGWIVVGSSQWNKLRSEATVERLPSYISQTAISAARQSGWAVDASKSPAIVSVLRLNPVTKNVTVALSTPVAYAGNIDGVQYTTHDGVFHIYAKFGPDFVSREYNNAPMPYAACFNGGQCLHYDGLFPSHGCIHIPSMSYARYINRLPRGTTVVVHE
ncbi:MAG TPA: L,D-transpeptidase family protein [Candidatus Saccharimonadales bacterium]|nr:L,D-transpeptidase family protein [Candidatus Saccharimonadales bacterium]